MTKSGLPTKANMLWKEKYITAFSTWTDENKQAKVQISSLTAYLFS